MINSKTKKGYVINIPSSFHGYDAIEILGSGSSSIVVLIEDQITHERYSAKIISKTDAENSSKPNSIFKEIQILKSISHPNIIKYHDSFKIKNEDEEEFYVIVTEYCEKGNLSSYLNNEKCTDEKLKKEIICQFLSAVQYLHEKGISHGDLKMDNILLTSDLTVKLCDFGFCRTKIIVGEDCKNGSLYYAAPELFFKGYFNALKSDVYAIGITLYLINELQFPFQDGDEDFVIKQIMNSSLSIRNDMNPQLKSIIERCTNRNPQLRPTVKEILNSDYFKNEKNQIFIKKHQVSVSSNIKNNNCILNLI